MSWINGILKRRKRKAPKSKKERADSFFALPRIERTHPPRYYLSLVAIVKDEAPYLDEWINFHQLVGVEHFYIYDNGSTDGTPEILSRYYEVTLLPWPNFMPRPRMQRSAYAHALAAFGHECRWIIVIDADEFVFPLAAESLKDALTPHEHLPCIVMPWQMFGSAGHKTKPNGLVIENYTLRGTGQYEGKSIFDPTRVTQINPHLFMGPDDQHFAPEAVAINHYYTRSLAEFEQRIRRGRLASDTPDCPQRALKEALARSIEENAVEDLRIKRFVPALKTKMGF